MRLSNERSKTVFESVDDSKWATRSVLSHLSNALVEAGRDFAVTADHLRDGWRGWLQVLRFLRLRRKLAFATYTYPTDAARVTSMTRKLSIARWYLAALPYAALLAVAGLVVVDSPSSGGGKTFFGSLLSGLSDWWSGLSTTDKTVVIVGILGAVLLGAGLYWSFFATTLPEIAPSLGYGQALEKLAEIAPLQRLASFEAWAAARPLATGYGWQASMSALPDGGAVWAGTMGMAVVISNIGQVFLGNINVAGQFVYGLPSSPSFRYSINCSS